MDVAAHLSSALAGRYTIDREIGAGGMATVYLARDVRHDRRVALKVLKPELGAVLGVDRFLSEIRVTANLQHPNLLPLFDSGEADGHLYYVMPFIEGESLRHRIDREKQLPVDEALHIGTAIAGALDYAHRHGVIHRDLKPENILLHEGQPLVADFGIALAVSNAGGARITQTGLSLGTPQYMSPEQATGDRTIDGRTDIYSLGAVLYEMLTGDPPHLGSTAQAVIAKVLTDRPRSVRASRASVPAHVSSAIDRALEKLPADRFASAHEFSEALRGKVIVGHETDRTAPVAAPRTTRVTPALALLGAATVVASALALWGWLRSSPVPNAAPARFIVTLPPDVAVDNVFAPLTITRDGRTIVFRAWVGSSIRLVRRRIDELDVQSLPGTEGGGWPTISPDSRWVAFRNGSQLRKTPVDGGPSVVIAGISEAAGNGFDWASNDAIVIGSGGSKAPVLQVVSASGGKISLVGKLDSANGEVAQSWPRVLSDGNTVVYTSWPKEGLPGARLAVTTLSSGESRILDVAGTTPLGVYEGHLLYVSGDGVLMAIPFDIRARKTTGPPIALIEGINVNRAVGAARVALANNGTLVYLSGGTASQLVATDSTGVAQTLLPQADYFAAPAWSPDGRRIALSIANPLGNDIWIYDVASRALSRFTSDGSSNNPVWTLDGTHIVFSSSRGGRASAWWQLADGSKPAEKLFEAPGRVITEAAMAPDGHTIVYRTQPQNEIFSVDVTGDRTPKVLVPDRFTKVHPALSPNGKWLAYSSNESTVPQVMLRPFPGSGGATQVSVDGGTEPVWSPNGRQLYYRHGRQVMAVTVTESPTLTLGERRVLFDGPYVTLGLGGHQSMSVSPDGKRFVLLKRLDDDSRLVVTTNWFTELRAKIGSKKQ
jgi:serine/threonine-protein kinase